MTPSVTDPPSATQANRSFAASAILVRSDASLVCRRSSARPSWTSLCATLVGLSILCSGQLGFSRSLLATGNDADDAVELTIAVHPQWCHLSGRAASSELAQQLSFVVGDTFSRRCFSDEMTIVPGASGLPLEIDRLPELLLEMATADRPVTLQWYADTDRLVLSGESFGNVTRAAVELRLRMALADSTMPGASTTQIDNLIAVVDTPRSSARNSQALALVARREYSGADLPLLLEIQLHAIYFSNRESRVDAQEMPKLIDIVDQLSTLRPIADCPPLVITGYMVPNREETSERNSSLRRATAVRNQLMALGIPEERLTVEAVPELDSAGLTWRSGRVEMRLAKDPSKRSKARLASLDP